MHHLVDRWFVANVVRTALRAIMVRRACGRRWTRWGTAGRPVAAPARASRPSRGAPGWRAHGSDHVVVVRRRRCRSDARATVANARKRPCRCRTTSTVSFRVGIGVAPAAPAAAAAPARSRHTPRKRGTGRSDTDRPVHDPRLSDNPNVALPRSGRWLRTLVGHRPAMSFVEGHRTPTTMPTHELHVSRHYGGQFRQFRSVFADRVPRVRGYRPGSAPCNRSGRARTRGTSAERSAPGARSVIERAA